MKDFDTLKIKAVAFDFDGTLVDSNELKNPVFRDISKKNGVNQEVIDQVMSNLVGIDRYDIFEMMYHGLNNRKELIEDSLVEFKNRTEKLITETALIAGCLEFLEYLKTKNITCYVNSATPEKPLKDVFKKRNDINHYFADIFGGPKSKSDVLNIIINKHSLKQNELLMIGDNHNDLQGALAVGCPFWGIDFSSEQSKFTALNVNFSKNLFGPLAYFNLLDH